MIGAWFGRGPAPAVPVRLLNWCLCWILLPNLPFVVMWIVGAPPRYPEIIVVGIVGLVVRKAPFAWRYAAFAAALAYALILFISSIFNVALVALFFSVQFLLELRPAASPEYLGMAAAVVLTLLAGWRLLRLPANFEAPWQLAGAAGLLCAYAALDKAMSDHTRGAYARSAPAGAPFSSAAAQTRFGAAGDRHLVMVMVEAMGLPRDPALRARLFGRWQAPDIARLYTVETGSTSFYGSTTNAEVRELCGRWGAYDPLRDARDPDCLPARLASRGYETSAMHAFDGGLFERTGWYPNAGFRSALFREDLLRLGAGRCAGMFPGACDKDVPAIIGARLKAAQAKQFVYWLTLNTHLPVPDDARMKTGNCEKFDPALAEAHAMTCRLFRMWSELDAGLAAMLTDPALPPTDILIVGDHAPPFFDSKGRSLFDGGRVPWVMLRRRNDAAAAAPARHQLGHR
jgi:hypothetical protein